MPKKFIATIILDDEDIEGKAAEVGCSNEQVNSMFIDAELSNLYCNCSVSQVAFDEDEEENHM